MYSPSTIWMRLHALMLRLAAETRLSGLRSALATRAL
eukprot:CAMPEP_0173435196 /NCGR_PEP_ID=MMETSP1357-20121228/14456_1 /TAXON_ID=77926 /ORGANISM="Hemiselmis rufescens, Strain PCC563" /LENGTH=36 /DNA_ID= /DNA_START= /DNA_END= /DNA_ORIENTATION=